MASNLIANREAELKNKRICRLCLTQLEPLTNIFLDEGPNKNTVPLSLQIMACFSVEVLNNDGLPPLICDICRHLLEYCYKFRQNCNKSDISLRQYPVNGIWPQNSEFPKFPDELLEKLTQNTKNKSLQISPNKSRPRILNKNSVKILNKSVSLTVEPILSQPVIKRNEEGHMEVFTEIIDQPKFEENELIKNAAPVETNVFPCSYCERSFPLRQLLDIHMVNHNRERNFECSICEKGFFSKYDLAKHTLIHTGEKPYSCVVCNKSFARSTLLHRHEKTHTDQPKLLCVFCEKEFLSQSELDKHTERHKKSRPFSCKICDKSFAFKQGLERHETIHAKVQPFPCQYCDFSFSTPSKLSRHLTAHAGSRPFPCKLCPKSYLMSHHLTRHLRSHSQGSGSYRCYDCQNVFNTRDDLIYHSAVHATQNLICPLCKEQYETLEEVTDHIKQHSDGEQYACEFCDLIFMTAEKLQEHSDVEHSEDLAAYEEHTRNNIINVKKENVEYSGEYINQNGELIEEFLIEEYRPDSDQEVVDKLVKEVIKPENINRESKSRNESNGYKKEFIDLDESKAMELLEDDNILTEMDLEDLVRTESINNVSDDEPPRKILRGSTVINKTSVKDKSEAIDKNTKPKSNSKNDLCEKGKGSDIRTFLQQLPKSISIIKKEKPHSQKDKKAIGEYYGKKVIQLKTQSSKKVIPNTKTEISSNDKVSPRVLNNSEQRNKSKQSTPDNPIQMLIDNKKVRVKQIILTKNEVKAMKNEGKIEIKGRAMMLKQEHQNKKRKVSEAK